MALVRWEPVRELDSLQGDVNRLFDAFFQGRGGGASGGARRWVPAMDLTETDGRRVCTLEPGQDLDVRFDDQRALLAKIPGTGFYDQLTEKFGRLAS